MIFFQTHRDKMSRKVTAAEIALHLGCSVSAVSRAFNPEAPITQPLRMRILAAAEKLGYQPPVGRALARMTTGTITLVAGDLENPFYPMAANALSKAITARGRRTVLHTVPPQSEVDAVMDQVLAFRSDAVIVTSALMSSRIAKVCRETQVPVVLFNRVQTDARMTAVTCDNYGGGRLVGHRFLATGRQRIAMIGGRLDTSTHLERARGFADVLTEAGSAVINAQSGRYDYNASRLAAQELLSRRPLPDAIFCVNDLMAFAAIDAAREMGLRVPDDVAVIGFDDVKMAAWASYGLTTVQQPLDRMAEETLDLIEAQIADPLTLGTIRITPVALIARSSG